MIVGCQQSADGLPLSVVHHGEAYQKQQMQLRRGASLSGRSLPALSEPLLLMEAAVQRSQLHIADVSETLQQYTQLECQDPEVLTPWIIRLQQGMGCLSGVYESFL